MNVKDCFYFGRIVRKHSYKGEIVVKLEPDFLELINELESVWLEINHHLVPFFIEKIAFQRETFFRVKFEGVNTELEADQIVGKSIFLNQKYLPKTKEGEFFKHEIIGFQVVDIHYGEVGKVANVNDSTPQMLLEVDNGSKIIFIPLAAFVKKIDKKKQLITVETPEGLLDL